MSKSIEKMISDYIDNFLLSPKNKIAICEALMHEKRRRVEELYSSYIESEEDFNILLCAFDSSEYNRALFGFCSAFLYSDALFDRYKNFKDEQTNADFMNVLLYTYLKLDECGEKLKALEKRYGDELNFVESEELDHINEIVEALDVVLERIDDATNPQNRIEFVDVVVKTNIFKCNKNHKIEQIQAVVKIVDADGDIVEKSVSAGYCEDCEHYFILEKDFQKLKRYGVLLCRVVSEKVYYNNRNNAFDLQAESVLHQVGYNVSATEGLSTEQRWEILKMVVDSGLYSVSGLCSFLDYLIDKNQRVTTRDMSNAIYKWQIDRDFIAEYEEDSCRKINVNSFKERIYEELPF